MSGIEVVGLVLAVIPLVISGIEHYGEGVRTIGKIRRYQAELETLQLKLETEKTILANSLKLLLQACVEWEQWDGTLAKSRVWASTAMREHLCNSLGEQYDLFIKLATHMKDALLKLKCDLRIDENGKGPFPTDKQSVRRTLAQIKFGINLKAYHESLQDLRTNNNCLSEIVRQTLSIGPRRKSRRLRRDAPNFDRIRAEAASVFNSLQKSLSGTCRVSHRASLYMKAVSVHHRDYLTFPQHRETASFRIVLHHHSATLATHDSLSWTTEEAEIKRLPAEPGKDLLMAIAPKRLHSRPISHELVQQTQRHTRVREIRDLCNSLKRLRKAGHDKCLGYLPDVSADLRHGLWCPSKPFVDQSSASGTVPLTSILTGERHLRLRVADRARLGLALVMGMLRLHNTPWMTRQWGSHEIVLFNTSQGVLVDRPFISVDLHGSSREIGAGPKYFHRCKPIRNESVFALGLLLIEMCLGRPFRAMRSPEDVCRGGKGHNLTDFLTAIRLADVVKYKVDHRWADIIRRCIHCDFLPGSYDLSDRKLCQAVYERIVPLLEEEAHIVERRTKIA